MRFIVVKLGPNTVAYYGPYSDRADAVRAARAMNQGGNWCAQVQTLFPAQ